MKLTKEQKKFIEFRILKEGTFELFPQWGFMIYQNPIRENGKWLDTNPFTRSLNHYYFKIKEILDNGLVRGNFHCNETENDFYIDKCIVEKREWIEKMFMKLFYTPLCWIKNLLKGSG